MEGEPKITNQSLLIKILKKLNNIEAQIVTIQKETNHIKQKVDNMPVRKDGWLGGYWDNRHNAEVDF